MSETAKATLMEKLKAAGCLSYTDAKNAGLLPPTSPMKKAVKSSKPRKFNATKFSSVERACLLRGIIDVLHTQFNLWQSLDRMRNRIYFEDASWLEYNAKGKLLDGQKGRDEWDTPSSTIAKQVREKFQISDASRSPVIG